MGSQVATFFHHKPYEPCGGYRPNHIWVEPFGNWFREKHVGQQVGFNADVYGLAAGYDGELLDDWVLGVGGAYNNSSLHWHEGRGHAHANSFYGALYTDWMTKHAYVGASVLGGGDFFDTTRKIDFLTTHKRAKAHPHGFDVISQVSAAGFFGDKFIASPYADLTYLYFHHSKFRERKAGGLNLQVSSYASQTIRSEAGMNFRYLGTPNRACITPIVSLSWVGIYPIHRDHYHTRFVGAPIPFTVKGWNHSWNLFSPSAGLEISKDRFVFSLQYEAEIGSRFLAQKGNIRFDYSW